MSFFQNVMNQKVSPQEAAITCAVTALALSGDFKDAEKNIIASFRDQYPSLALMQEKQFQEVVDGVDIRVHTVGERIFATEMRSLASDYRYAARSGEALTAREIVIFRGWALGTTCS